MLAWDRSQDWELARFWHDLTRVTIQFQKDTPSVTELVAIRRCLPQFRHLPPAEVRAAIGTSGALPVGVLPSPEARQLIRATEAAGLRAIAEGASFASYLPFNRTTSTAWLIEDAEELAQVVRAMLADRVPVRHVEA